MKSARMIFAVLVTTILAACGGGNTGGVTGTAPGAPSGVTAVPGNRQAAVSFSAPASDGGNPITSYTVTASPGNITATGTASPIRVTGLTNGASYTFTVTAANAVGAGSASLPSASVMPVEPIVATLKLSTSGTIGNRALSGIGITITLPAGVTVMTWNGTVEDEVVTVSGAAAPGTVATPVYTAATGTAPATLSFVIASNSQNGFGVGEFATVSCIVARGSAVTANDFLLSGFTPADLSLAPLTGLTASYTAVIQ